MKTMDTLKKKLAAKTQASAEATAGNKAREFCRLWIGQEKVPKALLEPEMR